MSEWCKALRKGKPGEISVCAGAHVGLTLSWMVHMIFTSGYSVITRTMANALSKHPGMQKSPQDGENHS